MKFIRVILKKSPSTCEWIFPVGQLIKFTFYQKLQIATFHIDGEKAISGICENAGQEFYEFMEYSQSCMETFILIDPEFEDHETL